MPFLILFILLPILEIWAFINVGDEIGFFGTIGLCLLTALVGVSIAKIQGVFTLDAIRQSLKQGKMPLPEIMDGFLLMIAAVCLIIPGFITDTIGFALLIPPVRTLIKDRYGDAFKARSTMHARYNEQRTVLNEDVIEGDYERIDNNKPDA